jgi:hypothetical protein
MLQRTEPRTTASEAARRLTEIVAQLRELEAEIGAINWPFVWGRLQKRGLRVMMEAVRLLPRLFDAETIAIEAAREGNTRQLVAYLRSDRPMSRRLRRFAADLLARKIDRRGRPPGLRIGLITDLDFLVWAAHELERSWREAGYTNRGPGGGGIHEESAKAVVERWKTGEVQQIVERLRKGRVRPHIDRTKASYKHFRIGIETALKNWRRRPRIDGSSNLPN